MIRTLKNELKEEYIKWTQQRIKLEEYEDFIEIITPFVDMHHDYISLFLSRENNGFKLSDDGYIVDEITDLEINLNSSDKRKRIFETTLKIFGVNFNFETSELYIQFDKMKEYPDHQQRLIQCILRVSDMLLTSRNKVISFFTEDITKFFLNNDVFFNESASFVGKSGRNQTFDFILPRSKNIRPKLIKSINNPISESYKDPLLSFIDVQDIKNDHDFLVVANDTHIAISDKFRESLQNYNVDVLSWSDRTDWVTKLKSS